MGFFSWDCEGCKHSIRGGYSTYEISRWMTRVVILFQKYSGPITQGVYDGYGRLQGDAQRPVRFPPVADRNLGDEEPFTMYHEACWKILGSPDKFSCASRYARDQGYFTDFNPPEPKNQKDLEEILDFHRTEELLKA